MNPLTFTSFNSIQSQPQTMQINQPLALREGQVFHGTINKLYPDQTAEVQVGQHKLIAKLETPLKAGDAHFFQVTSTAAQTELKVVTGPMTQAMTPQQQMNQLLQNMNLPQTKELQQVLGHFMKEQVPISREQLLASESWMKTLPEGVTKQDALSAMQRMLEQKMPFTNQVFQALIHGAKTDGMSHVLQNFMNQLSTATGVNDQVKTNLLTQLQTLTKPLDAETGGVLLARAVEQLTDKTASVMNRIQALAVLKEAGIVPPNATLANWQSQQGPTQATLPLSTQPTQAGQLIQQVMTAKPEESTQMLQNIRTFIQNESLLTNNQKAQLNQLVDRFTQLPQNKQTMEVLARQLNEQLLKAFSANNDSRLFTQNEASLSTKDQILSLLKSDATLANNDAMLRALVRVSAQSAQPSVQAAFTQAEVQVQNAVDSKAMEQALKTVLKGLGISYEAALSNKAGDIQALALQLKPQVLSLLQELQIPSPLRDSGEMLMARMNGMQLLSGENGHQHQLIMQVPLDFFGKRMDATLQWNGRMGKDGKVDANFARVLFYLHMESLQETVIDMQVQNRIVTITVFNDNPQLNLLADSLKQSLKSGLLDKEYHLSGIFIKNLAQPIVDNVTKKSQNEIENTNSVDIRV